ncbi:MAG TPA: hypothetical protein VGQ37_17575 [Vicinamibacterales bacterium]|nr:hypothetical protein [Vicinamibacterales bacterium]
MSYHAYRGIAALLFCLRVTAGTSAQTGTNERITTLPAGEAYTSYGTTDASEIAPRLFAVPGFTNYCQGFKASEIRRLRITVAPGLHMQVGERFYLYEASALTITAFGAGGKVLERIPVALEASAKQGVLDENNGGVADGALVPLAPGTVRISVRTMCPGPKVATSFSLQVR